MTQLSERRALFAAHLASIAAGTAVFALLRATSPMLPMVWDEGNAIHRAEGIEHWFCRFNFGLRQPFSRQAIHDDWRYTTQVEGHPAFYGVVIAAGRWLSQGWLAPLDAARSGPIVLFSVAVAAAVYRVWRMASPVAALVGAAALVTMPRLFAHAHFASFDGPLTSCWVLAWALRGATALGMEPTYYWDGLDGAVLGWLRDHTGKDEKVAFGSSSPENWQLMRAWGTLGVASLPAEVGRLRWYVIQRRQSSLSDADRQLIAESQPAYRKTIRPVARGWGPWKLDVPIVEVYEYSDYRRARARR